MFFYAIMIIICACQNFLLAEPTVVSLGSDCQVAINLRLNQLRKEAYPFDWTITENFDSVVDSIEDNFAHWLDPSHLEYKGKQIYNTYYDISFVHDFPIVGKPGVSPEGDQQGFGLIVSNFMQYLPAAQEKFQRRITRFQTLLHSSTPVVFVRAYASPKAAKRFITLMKSRYPQLPFLLVVMCRECLLKAPWNIENVRNFYASDEKGNEFNWWWSHSTWKKAFIKVGLIKKK